MLMFMARAETSAVRTLKAKVGPRSAEFLSASRDTEDTLTAVPNMVCGLVNRKKADRAPATFPASSTWRGLLSCKGPAFPASKAPEGPALVETLATSHRRLPVFSPEGERPKAATLGQAPPWFLLVRHRGHDRPWWAGLLKVRFSGVDDVPMTAEVPSSNPPRVPFVLLLSLKT